MADMAASDQRWTSARERGIDDGLGFGDDVVEVIRAHEALRVDLVDVLRP